SVGAAAHRAQRAVRAAFSHGLGPAQRVAGKHREAMLGHGSTLGGAPSGSEAARLVGRYARRVGRRIRSYGLLARRPYGNELWPRPSPALLLDLARWRRHSPRDDVRRD